MIRTVFGLLLSVTLSTYPAFAQQTLSERSLEQLRAIAETVATTEIAPVPDLLMRATIAANQSDHMDIAPVRSALTRQLANLELVQLGPMRSMERKAHTLALTTMLGERLSPGRIAALYAAKVYYGRNCYGHADAAFGLARKSAQSADDDVWLALAALPRSPSLYLRNRAALRARVKAIVNEMHDSNLITKQTAKRLEDLPIANLSVGKGCAN